MSKSTQETIYNEVFISYSRENMEFARRIVEAIYDSGRDNIWIDWEDIEYAEDWWQKIQTGIESAYNFIFILTPDSARSQVCYDEVAHALKSGKRIIPIVHIEVTDKADLAKMHPTISQHNWLPFKENDDFEAGMKQLIQTIEKDLAHVRFHTRLQTRALEWQQFERNEAYLLSTGELTEAQAWLARAELEDKDPTPTALHRDYIDASQSAEDARQAEAERIARRVQNFQRASIGLGVVTVLAIIAVIYSSNQATQVNKQIAEQQSSATEIQAQANSAGREAMTAIAQVAIQQLGLSTLQQESALNADNAQTSEVLANNAKTEVAIQETAAHAAQEEANLALTGAIAAQAEADSALTEVSNVNATATEIQATLGNQETQQSIINAANIQGTQMAILNLTATQVQLNLQEAENRNVDLLNQVAQAETQVAQAETQSAQAETQVAQAESQRNYIQSQVDWLAARQFGILPLDITQTPALIFFATATAVADFDQWNPVTETFEGIEMVLVPAGCFWMGSNLGVPNERPVHEICFEEPFWIDKYEVTREQYQACVDARECEETPGIDYSSEANQPRNRVNWFQSNTYCESRAAHLPTEAEWEYAARGPYSLVYPWGNTYIADNVIGRDANVISVDARVISIDGDGDGDNLIGINVTNVPLIMTVNDMPLAPIGSRPKGVSWVGAEDMSGNLSEWVSSLYQDYPYVSDDGREEDLGDAVYYHVFRGGSFIDDSSGLRSATRVPTVLPQSGLNIGIRCARSYP